MFLFFPHCVSVVSVREGNPQPQLDLFFVLVFPPLCNSCFCQRAKSTAPVRFVFLFFPHCVTVVSVRERNPQPQLDLFLFFSPLCNCCFCQGGKSTAPVRFVFPHSVAIFHCEATLSGPAFPLDTDLNCYMLLKRQEKWQSPTTLCLGCTVNRRLPEITDEDNLTVFSYSGRVKSPEWRRQRRTADLRQF